jgi:hypothetical protein
MIKGETQLTAPMAGRMRGPSFRPRPRYWLIAKNGCGRIKVLTINLDGQEAMPVFSFREEAEMFLRFEAGGGWSVREASARGFASLLLDPHSSVKMVALDPLPELCDEGMNPLVSVRKEIFVQTLTGDSRGTRVAPNH